MVEKKNIILQHTNTSYDYSPPGGGGGRKNYPDREDRIQHANNIEALLNQSFSEELSQKESAGVPCKQGIYLEFSSKNGFDLKTDSLSNRTQDISLVNIHEDKENEITRATVYIPEEKQNYFLNKVEDYKHHLTKSGHPKNNELVSSIEEIHRADVLAFWFGSKDLIPKETKRWCEVWFRYNVKKEMPSDYVYTHIEPEILRMCNELHIEIKDEKIVFPERIVKLLFANERDLVNLINACELVSEIRLAQEVASFFLDESGSEQKEWNKDLLQRTSFEMDGTSVCLLDTGLNNGHDLLSQATNPDHIQAINEAWPPSDHQGHGTSMAGVALYYDLVDKLDSTDSFRITHEIESVKILPPAGENPVELYGDLTMNAINIAEIANPSANRVICMAVTSSENNTVDGSPTSWSGAIDNITSGAYDEDNVKRLMIISAGNVRPEEFKEEFSYPEVNRIHSVESPGQAWNAVTVGAYSSKVDIEDPSYKGFQAVADVEELSPYSSTSLMWSSKWPIKPDVLFDGGNVATNGSDYTACDDLSLLTTWKDPLIRQYSTINATSSASAQAAWFAAQLVSEYPELWPETIRALMIHSASWTDKMKNQFCSDDKKTTGRRELLRTCGYGIPDLQTAIQCFSNSVNMIIEGELQPYKRVLQPKKKEVMNEMHIHKLPWPKEMLLDLGDTPVTLKVTLSYFIEPGPGSVGWKDKYRYASCGLRFDVINSDESLNDFEKRVNAKMRGDDTTDSGDGTSGSTRWYLGSSNRDVGSIHSDMMIDINASDLCECKYIAVYPVGGWWKTRAYLNKFDSKQRYSLIVSLSTPDSTVDLYTEIQTKIGNTVQISV